METEGGGGGGGGGKMTVSKVNHVTALRHTVCQQSLTQ